MKEIIKAKSIRNSINAPPSKAHTLRAIIIASLASGRSIIDNALIAEDQEYAIKAMQQLGAKITYDTKSRTILIEGVDGKLIAPKETIFIGNSGLTVRFLVSILGLTTGEDYVIIDGIERMREGRPLQDLLDALKPLGVDAVSINGNGCPPIKVKTNSLIGGVTELNGDKSSQYFSSILVAAPYAKKDVEIKTIGHLSSKPYLDVTLSSMKEFGVTGTHNNYQNFKVKANQKYVGRKLKIEGDYSNSAYYFAACAILGGKLRVNEMQKESMQGDKFFVNAMEKMGCKINWQSDFIEIESEGVDIINKKSFLKGIKEVDMNDYPDIVMPLCVVAAFAEGETKITNIAHLKFKESDRISVTVEELKKLGADVESGDDYILVKGHGGVGLHGAQIDSHNDHRIAMSFTIAGLKIEGVKIINERAVDKSFPEFYEEIEKIVVR